MRIEAGVSDFIQHRHGKDKRQNDEEYRNLVIDKIEHFGSFSWALILLAQIVQTVLAVD